jgi:hypothetical protein
MQRALCGLGLVLACCGPAHAMPRTYLTVSGGADVLAETSAGEVMDERTVGQLDIGIGTQLGDDMLLEVSFGRLGTFEDPDPTLITDPTDPLLQAPDHAKTYRMEVNPLMLRLRYAHGGVRTGYIKPELSAGLGIYSVTRSLLPLIGIPPATENDLLPAVELGIAGLMVMQKNWMGFLAARYTLTKRLQLVEDVDNLDGLSILLGFRFFLNSPRDEFEPEDE